MEDSQFSGIDPLRVAEARRRVAVIKEFLLLPAPTTADMVRHAAKIGLSRFQFARLVRIWREHRDAGLLVSGRRRPSMRVYGIDPRAATIADRAVKAAGGTGELAGVVSEIECRCAEAGVAPPSRASIWKLLRTARARHEMDGPPRIVIGRMWFHIPVAGAPVGGMPTLLAAIMLPERLIVAFRISLDDEHPPRIHDLMGDVLALRTYGAEARPLLLEANDRRMAAAAFEWAGLDGIKAHQRSIQREVSRAFGGRFGSLAAIYRRSLARPATRVTLKRHDMPLSSRAARRLIAAAVAENNAAAGAPLPAFDISAD